MLVVAGEPSGRSWDDRLIDLRVEDHSDPVPELKRLLRLRRAYQAYDRGEYEEALRIAPEKPAIKAMAAFKRAEAGRLNEAASLFREVLEQNDQWLETMRRMVPSGRIERGAAEKLESALRRQR
jgi:uncharacterized Ntn-hydrolase superfamily protein